MKIIKLTEEDILHLKRRTENGEMQGDNIEAALRLGFNEAKRQIHQQLQVCIKDLIDLECLIEDSQ